jgi:hypothetical protein
MPLVGLIWHFFVTLWHKLLSCKSEPSEQQFINETERVVVFFPEIMGAPREFRRPGMIPSFRPESAASSDNDEAENDRELGEAGAEQNDQVVPQPGEMDEDHGRITPEPDYETADGYSSGFYRHPDGIIEIQIHRSRGRFHEIPKG